MTHGPNSLARRLAWQYGPERAAAIMAGHDQRAKADLARWRQVGAYGALLDRLLLALAAVVADR